MPHRAPIHKPSYWKPRPPRVDDDREQAHNRGYDWRWRKFRLAFLREHPLCAECERNGMVQPATVVDHIEPHRGDKALFWKTGNHQSLCATCHNRKTARGG